MPGTFCVIACFAGWFRCRGNAAHCLRRCWRRAAPSPVWSGGSVPTGSRNSAHSRSWLRTGPVRSGFAATPSEVRMEWLCYSYFSPQKSVYPTFSEPMHRNAMGKMTKRNDSNSGSMVALPYFLRLTVLNLTKYWDCGMFQRQNRGFFPHLQERRIPDCSGKNRILRRKHQ